jgi:hypothetical protein
MSGHDHLERAAEWRERFLEAAVQVERFRLFVRKYDSERAVLSDEDEAVLTQAHEVIVRIVDDFIEAAVEDYDAEQEGGMA